MREKQRTITPGHPPVGVLGGVADDIRLRFNNTTAGDAFRQRPHQYLANEIAGERDRINRQLRAGERQMAIHTTVRFQGIRSTHCAREGPGSNGSPKYWVSRATFPSRNSMTLTEWDGRPSYEMINSETHRSPTPVMRRTMKRLAFG